MKILFVGPGLLPIPPKGWGGIEHLVWDMKLALTKLNHDVKIVNTTNPKEIIYEINNYRPDFVHVQYDDWVLLCPYIQYPCAISTHFAYIEQIEKMADYKQRVFDHYPIVKPNIFALSDILNLLSKTINAGWFSICFKIFPSLIFINGLSANIVLLVVSIALTSALLL